MNEKSDVTSAADRAAPTRFLVQATITKREKIFKVSERRKIWLGSGLTI
jgi:hypothetical protein